MHIPHFFIQRITNKLYILNYTDDVAEISCGSIAQCKFNQSVNELILENVQLPDAAVYDHFFQNGNNISNNLKRISLRNLKIASGETIEDDIDTIEQLLQMLIPLSPQNYELEQRLKTEITDKMRKTMKSNEIEQLENKIKQEIYVKYNTFDENKLSNENNITKEWAANLEMIELCDCCDDLHRAIFYQLEDRLTQQQIVNSLKNLRALVFLPSVEATIDSDCISLIGCRLLNYICNQ